MGERLFEGLKLGKKIPQTDTFLFQGSYSLVLAESDLSFSLERGEVIAVRGPSGCGYLLNSPFSIRKTTLLKCIAQLTLLDEGKPFLWHKTPESWGYPSWRSRVLYVPQRPRTSN
jgi:ABC-type multidrug transport system ATPase subunit